MLKQVPCPVYHGSRRYNIRYDSNKVDLLCEDLRVAAGMDKLQDGHRKIIFLNVLIHEILHGLGAGDLTEWRYVNYIMYANTTYLENDPINEDGPKKGDLRTGLITHVLPISKRTKGIVRSRYRGPLLKD